MPYLAREYPLLQAVAFHLRYHPMPPVLGAVVFRCSLCRLHCELPTPEIATLVIYLKRTYLQLRTTLLRVYTVVTYWPAAAPVLLVM